MMGIVDKYQFIIIIENHFKSLSSKEDIEKSTEEMIKIINQEKDIAIKYLEF